MCLIFPERHEIGMSNLGFHQIYSLMAAHPAVACERGFHEPPFGTALFETSRRLRQFDTLAFELPFELKYVGMLAMLDRSGIPIRVSQRDRSHPFVIAGGVAFSTNPEPVSELVDVVVVGDTEPVLGTLLDTLAEHGRALRSRLVNVLASVPGDHPDLEHIVSGLVDDGYSVTVSSLRHDPASDALLATLARDGQRTATFVSQAGSPGLARRIGKELDEGVTENAAARSVTAGLRNITLCFMIGLPGETDGDIAALNDLVRRAVERMVAIQRERRPVGSLQARVSFFVPKPLTPFEDMPILAADALRSRMRRVRARG